MIICQLSIMTTTLAFPIENIIYEKPPLETSFFDIVNKYLIEITTVQDITILNNIYQWVNSNHTTFNTKLKFHQDSYHNFIRKEIYDQSGLFSIEFFYLAEKYFYIYVQTPTMKFYQYPSVNDSITIGSVQIWNYSIDNKNIMIRHQISKCNIDNRLHVHIDGKLVLFDNMFCYDLTREAGLRQSCLTKQTIKQLIIIPYIKDLIDSIPYTVNNTIETSIVDYQASSDKISFVFNDWSKFFIQTDNSVELINLKKNDKTVLLQKMYSKNGSIAHQLVCFDVNTFDIIFNGFCYEKPRKLDITIDLREKYGSKYFYDNYGFFMPTDTQENIDLEFNTHLTLQYLYTSLKSIIFQSVITKPRIYSLLNKPLTSVYHFHSNEHSLIILLNQYGCIQYISTNIYPLVPKSCGIIYDLGRNIIVKTSKYGFEAYKRSGSDTFTYDKRSGSDTFTYDKRSGSDTFTYDKRSGSDKQLVMIFRDEEKCINIKISDTLVFEMEFTENKKKYLNPGTFNYHNDLIPYIKSFKLFIRTGNNIESQNICKKLFNIDETDIKFDSIVDPDIMLKYLNKFNLAADYGEVYYDLVSDIYHDIFDDESMLTENQGGMGMDDLISRSIYRTILYNYPTEIKNSSYEFIQTCNKHLMSQLIKISGETDKSNSYMVTRFDSQGTPIEREIIDRQNLNSVKRMGANTNATVFGYKACITSDNRMCVVTMKIPSGAKVAIDTSVLKRRTDEVTVVSIDPIIYYKRSGSNTFTYDKRSGSDTFTYDKRSGSDTFTYDKHKRSGSDMYDKYIFVKDILTDDKLLDQCFICLDNPADTHLLPCRHMICNRCSVILPYKLCPYCRQTILSSKQLVNIEMDEVTKNIIANIELNPTRAYSFLNQSDFYYEVGQCIKIDDFETDLDKVCGKGIHYHATINEVFKWFEFLDVPEWVMLDMYPIVENISEQIGLQTNIKSMEVVILDKFNELVTPTDESLLKKIMLVPNMMIKGESVEQSAIIVNETLSVDLKVAGLINKNNVCFINACIQILYNTPQMRRAIVETDLIATGSNVSLISHFKQLLHMIHSSSKPIIIDDHLFKNKFMELYPQFADGKHHDSLEAMQYILNQFKSELTTTVQLNYTKDDIIRTDGLVQWQQYLSTNWSLPTIIFTGMTQTDLCCSECEHLTSTFDPI